MPGIKLRKKGYIKVVPKLRKLSIINIIWVLGNTAQKQEIKYQKKNNNKKFNIKKITNLITKHLFTVFDLDTIVV